MEGCKTIYIVRSLLEFCYFGNLCCCGGCHGKWALVVGFEDKKLDDMKQIYEDYGIAIHSSHSIAEAIEILEVKNDYIIVAVFLYDVESLSYIQMIRYLTNAPIIILKDI